MTTSDVHSTRPHAGETVRILVVESEGMRYAAARILAMRFATVRAVPDGKHAVESFHMFEPDLVVLNLGFAVAERVACWNGIIRPPESDVRRMLLVLSDSRSRLDEMTALDIGADDYLKKPVSATRLCCRVQAILRRTLAERSPGLRHPAQLPSRQTGLTS